MAVARPATARPPLFRHPWRIVITVVVLLTVVNLAIVLLNESDTNREGRTFPNGIETVSPRPGELLRPQDTINADLRNDLTGVLLIDGAEVPEDQTLRVENLGEVGFRTGPGTDIESFKPGLHTATILFWQQGKPRPSRPAAYSWTFRVSA
jgi:hypothetical protein